jgi:hypothetical protein
MTYNVNYWLLNDENEPHTNLLSPFYILEPASRPILSFSLALGVGGNK